MIFIIFESRHKICSKTKKTWFLLVYWVAKNSKMKEKIQKQSPEPSRCSVKFDTYWVFKWILTQDIKFWIKCIIRPVEIAKGGTGWGDCSPPPRFLLNYFFNELKKNSVKVKNSTKS